MATIQEHLQRKRVPIDTWDLKEKLFLASAVVRSGDQNWMTVSRTMKSLGYVARPADWYSQKNCAAQYGLLLENVETPKRKKRTSGSETIMETPSESILRRLKEERILELKRLIAEEKCIYLKLKEDIDSVRSGRTDETQLKEMCLQIDQEKKQKERETILHAEWLREREEKKLELERAWRPTSKLISPVGHKRKLSDSIDGDSIKMEPITDESGQDSCKPAMSPLLTSLLKSPSPAPNVTSVVHHSAIISNSCGSSPTIASLLSSSPEVTVSPGLQQLVSTAIGQEPLHTDVSAPTIGTNTVSKELSSLPVTTIISNVSGVASLDKSILQTDIKKGSIDHEVIIAGDNIEEEIQLIEEVLKDVEESERKEENIVLSDVVAESSKIGEIKNELDKSVGKTLKEVKREDIGYKETSISIPEVKDVKSEDLTRSDFHSKEKTLDASNVAEKCNILEIDKIKADIDKNIDESNESKNSFEDVKEIKTEPVFDNVNVNLDKELNEESIKSEEVEEENRSSADFSENSEIEKQIVPCDSKISDRIKESSNSSPETTNEKSILKESNEDSVSSVGTPANSSLDCNFDEQLDKKNISNSPVNLRQDTPQVKIDIENTESVHKPLFSEFTEADFDDVAIGVIKSEKAKRDYSRLRKKEEREIDFFLASEKDFDDKDYSEDVCSEKVSLELEKKIDNKVKVKIEPDRSESPWTEEEAEVSLARTRRRYSTPATPSDSVPNSPASSLTGFDDDKEYRSWKKSIMLVYNTLVMRKEASLFLKPITDEQAPGYHGIVREAKDLQTLRKNIENGQIRNTNEFIRYVLVMFQNAIMYNKTNDFIYSMAKEMQDECIQEIKKWLLVQAHIEMPVRRELRTSEPGLKQKREELSAKSRKRKLD